MLRLPLFSLVVLLQLLAVVTTGAAKNQARMTRGNSKIKTKRSTLYTPSNDNFGAIRQGGKRNFDGIVASKQVFTDKVNPNDILNFGAIGDPSFLSYSKSIGKKETKIQRIRRYGRDSRGLLSAKDARFYNMLEEISETVEEFFGKDDDNDDDDKSDGNFWEEFGLDENLSDEFLKFLKDIGEDKEWFEDLDWFHIDWGHLWEDQLWLHFLQNVIPAEILEWFEEWLEEFFEEEYEEYEHEWHIEYEDFVGEYEEYEDLQEDETIAPSRNPTDAPSYSPSQSPTDSPTNSPTLSPSVTPTSVPTESLLVTQFIDPCMSLQVRECKRRSVRKQCKWSVRKRQCNMKPKWARKHAPTAHPTSKPTRYPTQHPTTPMPTAKPTRK